jgi:hypothetical protein
VAPVPRNWGPGKDESSRSENITPDKVAKAPPIRFLGILGLRLQANALIDSVFCVGCRITTGKRRSIAGKLSKGAKSGKCQAGNKRSLVVLGQRHQPERISPPGTTSDGRPGVGDQSFRPSTAKILSMGFVHGWSARSNNPQ